jgi:hypothetical protein
VAGGGNSSAKMPKAKRFARIGDCGREGDSDEILPLQLPERRVKTLALFD